MTLVCADKDLAIIKPAMSRIVLRDMTVLFLCNCTLLGSEILIFPDKVLIGLIASYEDYVLLNCAETDLSANLIPSVMVHYLEIHAPLLVHLPNVDVLFRLGAKRDQQLVVQGGEGHRDERLMLKLLDLN